MKRSLTILSVTSLAVVLFFTALFLKADTEKPISTKETPTIAFINVTVIPMTEDGLVLENQTVTVNSGRIGRIIPTREKHLAGGAYEYEIDGTNAGSMGNYYRSWRL